MNDKRNISQGNFERSSYMLSKSVHGSMLSMKREWIENRLKALGKKKVGLARHLEIPHTRVSEILRGARNILTNEISKAAAFLEISEADLIESLSKNDLVTSRKDQLTPIDVGAEQIPLIGNVQAGAFIEAFETEPEELFPAFGPVTEKENVFCLKVIGDSMDKVYPEGTVLYCQRLIDYPADLKDGKRVIVKRRAAGDLFEATVKVYSFDGESTTLSPLSNNPKHKPVSYSNGDADHHDAGAADIHIWAVVVGAFTSEA